MYELIQVSANNYYIESPAKVGLIAVGGGDVVLIDSGNNKDAGKKILKLLTANDWRLKAIFNTHYHADHIGGNAYLQAQTGCKIYAPDIECGLIRHPVFEPALLYGGNPPAELRHKFLLAQPSEAVCLTPDVLPAGVEILPLPGHSFGMVGFHTAEGTVYLADALSGTETLEKYRIGFLTDIAAYVETLETVKQLSARQFVPSHAAATADIAPLAQYNIDCTRQVSDTLLSLCRQPLTFEALLQAVFAEYGLEMTFEQHALVGSTVKSYLTWLKNAERLSCFVENNRLLYTAR